MTKFLLITISALCIFKTKSVAQSGVAQAEKSAFEAQAAVMAPLLNMGAINSAQPKSAVTPGATGYYLSYDKGDLYFNTLRKTICKLQKGDILNKWKAENYDNGVLGMVAGSEAGTKNGKGSYAYFENGAIYWTHNKGAFTITGPFMQYYKTAGLEESKELGFPKSDAIQIKSKSFTMYQQFEFGTLFYNSTKKTVQYSNDPNATTL